LRRTQTSAEVIVWSALRSRRLGAKWRRQHPVGPYVLDVFCAEARVAVELDGDSHYVGDGPVRDVERDAYLAARGIRVLRFTNDQVFRELDAVLERVWGEIQFVRSPPSP
ncbi:MAG TPA: endonuclease domain-containing protein, partial [Anaeromyxobacteraceae bacterium]|nr:endonuclease domain-containing protein [Anaeromyxobacteraceae bacterium]